MILINPGSENKGGGDLEALTYPHHKQFNSISGLKRHTTPHFFV
jgi:hypothetical protein